MYRTDKSTIVCPQCAANVPLSAAKCQDCGFTRSNVKEEVQRTSFFLGRASKTEFLAFFVPYACISVPLFILNFMNLIGDPATASSPARSGFLLVVALMIDALFSVCIMRRLRDVGMSPWFAILWFADPIAHCFLGDNYRIAAMQGVGFLSLACHGFLLYFLFHPSKHPDTTFVPPTFTS